MYQIVRYYGECCRNIEVKYNGDCCTKSKAYHKRNLKLLTICCQCRFESRRELVRDDQSEFGQECQVFTCFLGRLLESVHMAVWIQFAQMRGSGLGQVKEMRSGWDMF